MINLVKKQESGNFLLVLLDEKEYIKQLHVIIKSLEKEVTNICYVCLSRPYKDVAESLRENGIRTDKFMFIDVLSSHYGKPNPVKNCIFLDSPQNLDAIQTAIKQTIIKEKLSALIFDTVSAMLIYHEIFPILHFTHGLMSEMERESVKKVYFVLKSTTIDKESTEMIEDLKMFADKLIDPALKKI